MLSVVKSYWSFVLIAVIAIALSFSNSRWKTADTYTYDVWGYHNYLPSFFLYKDLGTYTHLDSLYNKYHPSGTDHAWYHLYKQESTGLYCNSYPIGVAVFQAPLFLFAHYWGLYSHQYATDGYSDGYEHSTAMTSLLFGILAMLVLLRFLLRHFSAGVSNITCMLLFFATNVFNYILYESGMAHVYTFFICACFLSVLDRWLRSYRLRDAALLGFIFGLALITRPTSGLLLLLALPLAVNAGFFRQGSKLVAQSIALAGGVALLVCLPQILYWKYTANAFVFYSYTGGDFFDFAKPRVWNGLFSFRKGWFIYTPVSFLAVVCFSYLYHSQKWRMWFWPSICFLGVFIYVSFCWNMWFYGWSFGSRPMIDILPLLALPLALWLQGAAKIVWFKKYIIGICLASLVALNLFQFWQYVGGILHGSCMSTALYNKIWLRTSYPADWKQLVDKENTSDFIGKGFDAH
jgi:hypothetical protein